MVIRRQDLGVLVSYCAGFSTIRNLVFRLRREPVARFVMFHDIPSEALGAFEANLGFLKRSTNVIGLDDFFSGRLSIKKINVVITFDDGFQSWVTTAVPLLKRLELPATFFISSGFVGLSRENEVEFMRSKLLLNLEPESKTTGLKLEDVRRIVDEGFTVGGHTVNHCSLGKVRDSVQLRYEIAEDKAVLERITGRNIDYFAYPFGANQNEESNLTEVLMEVGYRGAVTTISGFNTGATNPYLLHRELTYASMPGVVFRARVLGNYDAVSFLKLQLHKILRRR
jgi:peptidoglycan/xylan/chitin deacetylase (PgdA/CDA1 family)